MRVLISGLVTGFRIKKAMSKNETDVGMLDIVQPGDKNIDSALIFTYVQDTDLIEHLLKQYAEGQLRWINAYCVEMQLGREKVFFLLKILELQNPLKLGESENDRGSSDTDDWSLDEYSTNIN